MPLLFWVIGSIAILGVTLLGMLIPYVVRRVAGNPAGKLRKRIDGLWLWICVIVLLTFVVFGPIIVGAIIWEAVIGG